MDPVGQMTFEYADRSSPLEGQLSKRANRRMRIWPAGEYHVGRVVPLNNPVQGSASRTWDMQEDYRLTHSHPPLMGRWCWDLQYLHSSRCYYVPLMSKDATFSVLPSPT